MSTIRLAADENFNHKLLPPLRSRLPELDLVTVQEAGRSGDDDPEVLAWAASEGRILLSSDRSSLAGYALSRVQDGLPMPGVFLIRPGSSFPELLDEIVVLAECAVEGEFEGKVSYLPMTLKTS
jgi:predicted nuclease of predicted toxin-antitoxin system